MKTIKTGSDPLLIRYILWLAFSAPLMGLANPGSSNPVAAGPHPTAPSHPAISLGHAAPAWNTISSRPAFPSSPIASSRPAGSSRSSIPSHAVALSHPAASSPRSIAPAPAPKDTTRRIVNIVNFIRQTEPRIAAITEDVLYETVRQEVLLLAKYKFPGTFLLQYDALINPRYQQLLKTGLVPGSEIGGWWEITQPQVEAAGLPWRGRYSWDWHANVGFSTGYTPHEREILVDVYMEKFKSIFGKYPTAIASWFIDEHSLAYMYDKYHIQATANCKDQIGTDGYTLWGGYWNQAYYPSRRNAYMPAQTAASQIKVPVFRMLGSDPIYQYESGLGGSMGVITLEPVYPWGGGSHEWTEWFLKSLAEEPCLGFAYTQAGQENSFTWERIKPGLEMQMPILDSLQKAGKISIETLSASGRWFTSKFPLTPATAVTAMTDYKQQGRKTVWYDSRYYRANIGWKDDSIRFRDFHLFDERLASPYLDKAGTSTQCIYKTLTVLDGYSWSTPTDLAGLRIMRLHPDGTTEELMSRNPVIRELPHHALQLEWTTGSGENFSLVFFEDHFEIQRIAGDKSLPWLLELHTAPGIELPFKTFEPQKITASYDGFEYAVTCTKGHIEKAAPGKPYVFRMIPADDKLIVNCINH